MNDTASTNSAADAAMPSDSAIDGVLDAMEADSALRRMWLAGERGEDIRSAIAGNVGLNIGVIGYRVQALGLPVRDHNLQVSGMQPIGEQSIHPLLNEEPPADDDED